MNKTHQRRSFSNLLSSKSSKNTPPQTPGSSLLSPSNAIYLSSDSLTNLIPGFKKRESAKLVPPSSPALPPHDPILTAPPPTSSSQLSKQIELLNSKLKTAKESTEIAKKKRILTQKKLNIVDGKLEELLVQKNHVCTKIDQLKDVGDSIKTTDKMTLISAPVNVLDDSFFIALCDTGSMGVINGERLGKVLSSKQIALALQMSNSNFSHSGNGNGNGGGNAAGDKYSPNSPSKKGSNNVYNVNQYKHPPTNLLHNTPCPDWSEVNAALGYSALLIRIMYDGWKSNDISPSANQVDWVIIPQGNLSKIVKYKAPQVYTNTPNNWNGIGASEGIFSEEDDGRSYINVAHVGNPTKANGSASSNTYPLFSSPSTLPTLIASSHYKHFNLGLKFLLLAVRDLSLLARQKDLTCTLPHPIIYGEVGGSGDEVKIGGLVWKVERDGGKGGGAAGGGDDTFNRCGKFYLTNLKWLIAFYSKQQYC